MAWALSFTSSPDSYLRVYNDSSSRNKTYVYDIDVSTAADGSHELFLVSRNGNRQNITLTFNKSGNICTVTKIVHDITSINVSVQINDTALVIEYITHSNNKVSCTVNSTAVLTNASVFDSRIYLEYFNASPSYASRAIDVLVTKISIYNEDKTQLLLDLDADASDHNGTTDQPKLTNNVGSDADGIGFPSFDASVWVDLGGGGTTIQESISFNSVSQHAISNSALMGAAITAGSISTVNNQTQITLNASIVATTSANFSLSTNATLNGTLEINSSPAVLMQNIVQAQANLLINSNAGFILSLGNAIKESLSFNSVAGDGANINVTFAGELFINSVAAVDLINTANLQGQLNIGSASAMSLVTSAIMSAGLDFSSISNVALTPGGIIVDITTPDSRTLTIAISDREFKITATNRETTVTSNNRTFDVPQK